MTSIKNYALCLAIFLVTTLARTSLNILLQYISKGDDLSFAEAGYTLSIKAIVSFILHTFVVPQLFPVLNRAKKIAAVSGKSAGAPK